MNEQPPAKNEATRLREEMLSQQIAARGIRDPRLLSAFRRIPREVFMPGLPLDEVYADHPVPIGYGQKISQPYMVALMLEAAAPKQSDRALEVGTGSGYVAALLAMLCEQVYTVERIPELAATARDRLQRLGYSNVHVRCSNGTLGWPEEAPFDVIIVSAAAPTVPPSLLAQLADGGRLVIPVGEEGFQDLLRIERRGTNYHRKSYGGCVFVKLIGKEAWPEES